MLVCGWCRREFTMADNRTAFCSSGCAEDGGRHRALNGGHLDRSLLTWGVCAECGVWFIRRGQAQKRCPSCCIPEPARLRRKSARRRAAVAAGDPIDPVEVAARDEWRCGICGSSVDPSLVFPHPDSRSIDHVVPISRGGAHVEANVQLAHLLCNMLKNDRLPV